MDGQFRFDLEAVRHRREGFDKAARHYMVAREQITECAAKSSHHNPCEQAVAEAVAGAIGFPGGGTPRPFHHVEPCRD
jgi:hypothetical protein